MKINFITRQLIRSAQKGFLATNFNPKNFDKINTTMRNTFPYSTFTLTAFDYDLSPIILLSDLSEHTTNILEDSSASIMLCEDKKLHKLFPKFNRIKLEYEDPMSRPRVTLIGKIKKSTNKNHKKRFLSRHPVSSLYANFKDMNIYKMNVKSAHLIGGFAHVKWFKYQELVSKKFVNFEEMETDIIKHMNSHHAESINLYVNKLMTDQLSAKDRNGKWRITGVDPDGFDLRKRNLLSRFYFKKELTDAKKLRGMFVSLHKQSMKKFN